MKSQITFTNQFSLSQNIQNDLQAYINWQKPPNLIRKGRSGYVQLDSGISIDSPRYPKIQLLKLKGLGFFDPEQNLNYAPGQDVYQGGSQQNDQGVVEKANRLVVDDKGVFQFKDLEDKPFGGQFYRRVETEFQALEKLFDPAKPLISYLPIAAAKYTHRQFQGQDIGVVVMGLPTTDFTLLEEYFVFQEKDGQMLVSNRFNPRATAVDYLEMINGFCTQLGAQLNRLHQHFVGLEGHLANVTVLPKSQEVLIHDLDYLSAVADLSLPQKFNYYLRDVVSYLIAIITNTLFSDPLAFAPALEQYGHNIFDFNFLKSFLVGYHEDCQSQVDDYLDGVWRDILSLYFNQLRGLPARERLLSLHPAAVKFKMDLLEQLHPFFAHLFELQGAKVGYSFADHQKNIQQLWLSFQGNKG